MPLVNGIATAGNAEATRVAQTLIQRVAEAGVLAIAGERTDRARAERIPEAGEAARIGRRPPREQRGRGGGDARHEQPAPDDPECGGLIDLQA